MKRLHQTSHQTSAQPPWRGDPQTSGDPSWRPPAEWAPPDQATLVTTDPQFGTRRRTGYWHRLPTAARVLVTALVVAAMLIGLIGALGGFNERQTLVDRPVGDVIDIGPVEVVLKRAVTYPSYSGGSIVEIAATCQLTQSVGNTMMYPMADAAMAGVRVNDQPIVAGEARVQFGVTEYTWATTRNYLSPGLRPMPCVYQFDFSADLTQGDTVTVLLWQLQWIETLNVRNDEDTSRTWEPDVDGFRVQLPLNHETR